MLPPSARCDHEPLRRRCLSEPWAGTNTWRGTGPTVERQAGRECSGQGEAAADRRGVLLLPSISFVSLLWPQLDPIALRRTRRRHRSRSPVRRGTEKGKGTETETETGPRNRAHPPVSPRKVQSATRKHLFHARTACRKPESARSGAALSGYRPARADAAGAPAASGGSSSASAVRSKRRPRALFRLNISF